ncbi:hypothetical protein RA210_U140086 [Rubrivivax sp. A210]|nr:hypothetical protein RA210_U140086 [Rubrivivax sp. A210]
MNFMRPALTGQSSGLTWPVRVRTPATPQLTALVAESAGPPASGAGAFAGISGRLGTREPISSPAVQRCRHKANAGGSCPPRTSSPSTTQEVCHETERR